jgi:glutaredoxin/glutathione-dependent peroxiredoxin
VVAIGLQKLRFRTRADKYSTWFDAATISGTIYDLSLACSCCARPRQPSPHNTGRKDIMTIKVGDRLPAGTLSEYIEVATEACPVGPNQFQIDALTKGKKVVLFGLPGAFTPTCSGKHVPGYVTHFGELKAKGVDEIICMSVNDAFVMGAWAKDQKTEGKVRMMGDGSAAYTKALGLELDLTARGMGVRCQRFSALVDDGVVKSLNVEAPGKFEVSDAQTMLNQLG